MSPRPPVLKGWRRYPRGRNGCRCNHGAGRVRVHRRDFGRVGACRACLCCGWNLGQLLRGHRPQGGGRTCGFGGRIGRQESFFFFAQGLVGLPLCPFFAGVQALRIGVVQSRPAALASTQIGPLGHPVVEFFLLFGRKGCKGLGQSQPAAFLALAQYRPALCQWVEG